MRTSAFLAFFLALAGALLLAQFPDKATNPPAQPKPVEARKFCAKSSSHYMGYKFGKDLSSQVTIQGELSEQGGKGFLVLDPNQHYLTVYGEVAGGTKVGYPCYKVKFVSIPTPQGDGPPIYRLDGEQLPEEMVLVVHEKASRPWRLILGDKKSIQRVILLELGEASLTISEQ